MNDNDIARMVHEIARVQATRYYKEGGSSVANYVFAVILGIIAIQLIRSGVSEESLYNLYWVPDIVTSEMAKVGWDLTTINGVSL